MRGKGHAGALAHAAVGITPAYAGKSLYSLRDIKSEKDHPRLCGEKGSNGCNFPVLIGSPPPMRGKAILHTQLKPSFQDHPRLCGEKE